MTLRFKKMEQNNKGRDFAVGDIHGTFDLLDRAMDAVKFDPACDRIISVGDLINRGPSSARCLEFLRQKWFFAVRGNHERSFIKNFKEGFPSKAMEHGGSGEKLRWIFNEKSEDLNDMNRHILSLPTAIEVGTEKGPVGFVHGEIPLGMSWQEFTAGIEDSKQLRATATLGRERIHTEYTRGVAGIRQVFFGHTVQQNGPDSLGNCLYIDTGAYKTLHHPGENFGLTLVDIRAEAKDLKTARRVNECFIVLRPS
jgi:serine/threonine protein phosphatase 1